MKYHSKGYMPFCMDFCCWRSRSVVVPLKVDISFLADSLLRDAEENHGFLFGLTIYIMANKVTNSGQQS